MELKFTPLRVVILVGLVLGFGLLGGFTLPERLPTHLHRMWGLMILMFVIGAVMATVVDHWIGNLDRTNLRWFHIVLGVSAMLGAVMYLHVLRERVRIETESAGGAGAVAESHEGLALRTVPRAAGGGRRRALP